MGSQALAAVAGEILQERARTLRRSEAPITYGQLAQVLGMPPFKGPDWENHPLSQVLGHLNDEDHAVGRPFRSVLVLSGNTGYSGNSFFRVAEELRNSGVPIPLNRRYQYWADEFTRLLQHYHNPSA
jgi:hypothetical protein